MGPGASVDVFDCVTVTASLLQPLLGNQVDPASEVKWNADYCCCHVIAAVAAMDSTAAMQQGAADALNRQWGLVPTSQGA